MTPLPSPAKLSGESWFTNDRSPNVGMDYFLKTLSNIRTNGIRPDLVGSVIIHYAAKWLSDLSGQSSGESSPESSTTTWMKKRLRVETLVSALPPERDSVPCDFLLRLLRVASMVEAEPDCRAELERRAARQLEQASLAELMIPSFSHMYRTLLDVALVTRLVKGFIDLDEAARSGAALAKVGKVVDDYLAEAAIDSNLNMSDFMALAGALPAHARSIDDGLYRAIDTYFKAHPGVSKQERKNMCRLINSRKLSHEAALHATHNERLPVRVVIQILFSEQAKLQNSFNWSGSFTGTHSPCYLHSDQNARCQSKREIAKQMVIKKLRDDVSRLESQCAAIQGQMDRMSENRGLSKWKKMLKSVTDRVAGDFGGGTSADDLKTKSGKGKTPSKWRRSVS